MDQQTLPGGSHGLAARKEGPEGAVTGAAARSRISQPQGLDIARRELTQADLPCQGKARGELAAGARPRLIRTHSSSLG